MQRLDVRALAPDDARWFVDVLAGGERRELLFLKACNRLDGIVEESRSLVATRAAQGDPGSLWLMFRIDVTEPESEE